MGLLQLLLMEVKLEALLHTDQLSDLPATLDIILLALLHESVKPMHHGVGDNLCAYVSQINHLSSCFFID